MATCSECVFGHLNQPSDGDVWCELNGEVLYRNTFHCEKFCGMPAHPTPVWTSKIPSKPGVYWCKMYENTPKEGFEVCIAKWDEIDGGQLMFYVAGDDSSPYTMIDMRGGYFAGPLPEPKE